MAKDLRQPPIKRGQPIPPKLMERVAELAGMGLSHAEAAGAANISERTVARILSKPEYKRMAEDVRRRRTSITAQATAVVQDLLSAVDSKGNPDKAARQRGAELVMKNPELLREVEQLEGEDESLLPGVVLRFPWAGASTDSRISGAGAHAEAISADQPNSENGTTLPDELAAAFAEDLTPDSPPPTLDLDPGTTPEIGPLIDLPDNETATLTPPEPIPPTGTDSCSCGYPPYPPDAPYPACPHDLRGPPGTSGPTGDPPPEELTVGDLFSEADLPDE